MPSLIRFAFFYTALFLLISFLCGFSAGFAHAQESVDDAVDNVILSSGRTTEATQGHGVDSPIFRALPPDVQKQILDETEQVQRDCEVKAFYAKWHDCRCIAAKFLDERLERGPDADQAMMLVELGSKCVDEAGVAGYSYNECMNIGGNSSNPVDNDNYCTCYANKMAAIYRDNPATTISDITHLSIAAYGQCSSGGQ